MYPTHGSLVQRQSVIEHGNRTAEPQSFLQSQIHSQHHAFSLNSKICAFGLHPDAVTHRVQARIIHKYNFHAQLALPYGHVHVLGLGPIPTRPSTNDYALQLATF